LFQQFTISEICNVKQFEGTYDFFDEFFLLFATLWQRKFGIHHVFFFDGDSDSERGMVGGKSPRRMNSVLIEFA